MKHDLPAWSWWALALLVLFLAWARPGRGDTVTVTYVPATTDTAGAPLGPDTWTIIEQWAGACPGEYQQDGTGRWNVSGPHEAQFVQTKGSCSCYSVRTVALDKPQVARVSVPAEQEHCIAAAPCGGCHT